MNIKMLREAKKLQQKDLADMLNVTNGTISNWEKEIAEPSIDNLCKIADYFGVTTDYLLNRDDEKQLNYIKYELTPKENYVLESFRLLRETDQEMVIGFIKRFLISQ